MNNVPVEQYDEWLEDTGPAALVLTRKFKSVEGKDAWIFPPTFAQSESADDDDESGGDYQIDPPPKPDDPAPKNVCLIDSVGSQANRIEPVFKIPPYSELVPQHRVKMKDGDEVNLLDVGHRAGDAAVRFSKELGPKLWEAFKEYRDKRDCTDLAALAPTSLLFGVWDSRGTGTKIQRIVRSVIRAYNVVKAKRSATYQAPYDYTGNGVINPERDKGSGKNNPLSQEGFKYSLATGTHGGVQVKGDIQQEAIINLVALRTLTNHQALRRYLLGLSLVALSYRDQTTFNLREGCLLCAETPADLDGTWKLVDFNGMDRRVPVTHDVALAYAQAITDITTTGDDTADAGEDSATDSDRPDETAHEQDGGTTQPTTAEKFVVAQPSASYEFDTALVEDWLKIEKKKERRALAKKMPPSNAVAERKKKTAAADPSAKIKRLQSATRAFPS